VGVLLLLLQVVQQDVAQSSRQEQQVRFF